MPKKRVYELAKELGLENKELIAHLERIGITVKSHSSSLEDDEVERIKEELLAKEPKQIVEQRIKSTVIRRRAVRTPLEETQAGEEIDGETVRNPDRRLRILKLPVREPFLSMPGKQF